MPSLPQLTLPAQPPGPGSLENFGTRAFAFLQWWYATHGPELNAWVTALNALTAGDFGAASAAAFTALSEDFEDHAAAANPHSGSASTEALATVVSELTAHKAATPAHTAAQVGLANVTNDAQVKRTEMGMPGGTPTLNVDALVVQDPVSASTTPAPGAIPKAGLSGLLDAWISAASTAVAGLVQLATNAVAWAGTSTSQVITAAALWYVLTLATRLRISTNTTIYVSPTGSDSTGAGTAGSPYASIGKALLSIVGKSIDGGVTVTIQCADGTYNIANTIVIDHPDADKIQILGNTSAETTVAIAAIDTTAKTITVAGDYTGSIAAGDIIGLTGSSTSGLNGAYVVSGRSYSGGNTVITCSAETFASATVGGGSIVIKPCNRCALVFSSGISGIYITKAVKNISGLRVESPDTSAFSGLRVTEMAKASIGSVIVRRFNYGVFVDGNSYAQFIGSAVLKGCTTGLYATIGSKVIIQGWAQVVTDTLTTGIGAASLSYVTALAATIIQRLCTTPLSPPANTTGNANSYILN